MKTLADIDAYSAQNQQNLRPWQSGGLDAKEFIENVLATDNSGVSMQHWLVKRRSKLAKWLKRERGITLYLQRKRTQVKNHEGDFIPYYVDQDCTRALGLKKTPNNATPYTHSVRTMKKKEENVQAPSNCCPTKPQPSETTLPPQDPVDFWGKWPHEHTTVAKTEDGLLPVPPLPSNHDSFTYDTYVNPIVLSSDFSSYYYHPIDPYCFTIPPLEDTNQEFNVVS